MQSDVEKFMILLEEKYGEVSGDVFLVFMAGTLCYSLIQNWGKTECQPLGILYEEPREISQIADDLKIFSKNHVHVLDKQVEAKLAEIHDDAAFVIADSQKPEAVAGLIRKAGMGRMGEEKWSAPLVLAFRFKLPKEVSDEVLLLPLWEMDIRYQINVQDEKRRFLQGMVKFVKENTALIQWKVRKIKNVDVIPKFWRITIELIALMAERELTEEKDGNIRSQLLYSVRQFIRRSEDAADNSGLADAFLREFKEAYQLIPFVRRSDVQSLDSAKNAIVVTEQEYWLVDEIFEKIAKPLLPHTSSLQQIKEALLEKDILRTEGRFRKYYTKKESFQNDFGDWERVRLIHLERGKIDETDGLNLLEISEMYWKEEDKRCGLCLVRK